MLVHSAQMDISALPSYFEGMRTRLVDAPVSGPSGELWRVSHVNEVYLVSSLGRVWSTIKYGGKLLNEHVTDDGYVKVSCGVTKFYVHRLVAEAFLPPCPVGKTTVNHKDGRKRNNVVDNLEWASRKEQSEHCSLLGLRNVKGSRNGRALVTEEDVRAIRLLRISGSTVYALVARFGVSKQTVWDICARRTWGHVT